MKRGRHKLGRTRNWNEERDTQSWVWGFWHNVEEEKFEGCEGEWTEEKLTAVWGLSRVRIPPGSGLLIFRHEAGILSRVLLCSAEPAKLFLVSLLQLHTSLWQIDWACLFINITANCNVTVSFHFHNHKHFRSFSKFFILLWHDSDISDYTKVNTTKIKSFYNKTVQIKCFSFPLKVFKNPM